MEISYFKQMTKKKIVCNTDLCVVMKKMKSVLDALFDNWPVSLPNVSKIIYLGAFKQVDGIRPQVRRTAAELSHGPIYIV